MNKNVYFYDFVQNYLFRMFIPVPWFSLFLIYIWIPASETNLQIKYKQEYLEKLHSANEQKGKKKTRLEIEKGSYNPQMKGSGLVVTLN